MDVHKSKATFKLLIGGMGSAKSRCGVIEIINHVLTVPNGHTVIMAQTLKQLSKAIMPIFNEYLPRKYVEKWTDTKADIEIVLTNGHVITGMPSDDEEKLRSMDITAFLIEEASGIKRELFEECVRRLRNTHAIINGKQHFIGIVISNPAQGFIRELLFQARHIYGSKSIQKTVESYNDRLKDTNPDLEAFLSSSRDNTYLPKGFVERVINSLTPEQVRLYVDCIIEYAEGAVYPNFLQYLCDDFEIPKNWKRYMAHDPKHNWGLVGRPTLKLR
jgi:phage terminase large subunit